MILLVINLVVSAILLVMLMQAKMSSQRGTNTVTRFVRDTAAFTKYNIVILGGACLTILSFIIGIATKSAYACLPSLAIVILSFVLKNQSNKSAQRVKDARVVTKAGGKVVAATGAGIAATACAATGVGVGASAAIIAGTAGAMRVVDKSVDQMTDVNSPDISKEDFKEFNAVASKFSGIDIQHPEEFIMAANRAGIETDGRDLGEVANNVIKFAPPAMLAELPEDLTIEERAMRIMGGNVNHA